MASTPRLRVAINGFGRIGRTAFKVALERRDLEIVAINDLAEPEALAHLLRYDTAYGPYHRSVRVQAKTLIVGSTRALVLAEKEPAKLPWKKLKVDVVLECTGRFTDTASAGLHLKAGARKVIISAPPKGDGVSTVVLGVNDRTASASSVISNASCTTNCISPVAAIVHEKFGIRKAMMTTIHSYTADQNLQDAPHRDLRRARAAAENIVPTSTGAAISTTEIIPDLKGHFDGLSIRVPTPVVSLSDFTILLKRPTTAEGLNRAFIAAARSPRYRGILAVTNEPLVSSDFIKDPASAIVDLSLTSVVDGDLAKIVAWYDNEWGYSNRLVELALWAGRK